MPGKGLSRKSVSVAEGTQIACSSNRKRHDKYCPTFVHIFLRSLGQQFSPRNSYFFPRWRVVSARTGQQMTSCTHTASRRVCVVCPDASRCLFISRELRRYHLQLDSSGSTSQGVLLEKGLQTVSRKNEEQ